MKKSLEELRQELANATSYAENLAVKDRDEGLSDEEKQQFDASMELAEELTGLVGEREKRAALAQSIASIGANLGDGKDESEEDDSRYRDVVSKFVRSERFLAMARTKNRPGGWKVHAVEFSASNPADVTSENPADNMVTQVRPGIITPFVVPATVGALFTPGTMDGSNVARLTLAGEAAADVVPVGTLKPPSSATLGFDYEKAVKVATTLTAPEEALDDVPALETSLRAFLLDGPGGLSQKAEDQYVNGAGGGGGEMLGILTLNPTDNTIPGERASKSILFAALEIQRVTGYQADAVLLNPADAFQLMTEEDDNSRPLWGAFGAFYQNPAGPARFVISGKVPQGTAIVGAFKASILYTRKVQSIRASAEGIGLADENKIMFIAEGRQALVHNYGAAAYRTVSIETVSS